MSVVHVLDICLTLNYVTAIVELLSEALKRSAAFVTLTEIVSAQWDSRPM